MRRIATLNSRLRPWLTIDPEKDDTLQSLPTNLWDKLLKDAPKLTGLCRYWFKAGVLRAITEMERKAADDTPLFRTREQLIEHLKTIDHP